MTSQTPSPESELRPGERMRLAQAVYSLTGYLPPKGERDLSSVRNEVERMVEQIIAARPLPSGNGGAS